MVDYLWLALCTEIEKNVLKTNNLCTWVMHSICACDHMERHVHAAICTCDHMVATCTRDHMERHVHVITWSDNVVHVHDDSSTFDL